MKSEMVEFGLDARARSLLLAVFQRHLEIDEVRVFGSRAKGNQQKQSDVDLVFWGTIDTQLLARIAGELDELPLPYKFDVTLYSSLQNPTLKDHIDRVGSTIYRRAD